MRVLVLALLVGCVDISSEHRCRDDDDCVRTGITGRCEPTGNCSFADAKCGDDGFRYDVNAGARAGICVTRLNGPALLEALDLKQFSDDTKPSCGVDGGRNAYVELDSSMPQTLIVDTISQGTDTTARLALRAGPCGTPDAMERTCSAAPCSGLAYSRLVVDIEPGRSCLVIEEADPAAANAHLQLRVLPARRVATVLTGAGTTAGSTCGQGPVANQCANPMSTTASYLAPLCPGEALTFAAGPMAPLDAVLTIRHAHPDDPTTGGCLNNGPNQAPEMFSLPANEPDLLFVMVSGVSSCGSFTASYDVR